MGTFQFCWVSELLGGPWAYWFTRTGSQGRVLSCSEHTGPRWWRGGGGSDRCLLVERMELLFGKHTAEVWVQNVKVMSRTMVAWVWVSISVCVCVCWPVTSWARYSGPWWDRPASVITEWWLLTRSHGYKERCQCIKSLFTNLSMWGGGGTLNHHMAGRKAVQLYIECVDSLSEKWLLFVMKSLGFGSWGRGLHPASRLRLRRQKAHRF